MTTKYELGYSSVFDVTNLATNGTFDSDTGWTKQTGWSISGGKARCDGSQVGITLLYQDPSLIIGKKYEITFTILLYTAGIIRAYIGNTYGIARSANGTYTESLICTNNSLLYFGGDADFDGHIDNVILHEIETVTFYPEWDYSQGERQVRTEHRSKSGKLKLYKWYDYDKISFQANWVPASDAALVNSWWDSNAELYFYVTSSTHTEVHSVMLINDETPMANYNKPYNNYFKGKIELEGY